ncbi:ABC transporter permease [Rhizobium calliandrae]|uniref:ABC transporter permease n=1 Tax=Rhizobium calliandrae TaxID=1312182 RepID=A0ABT7KKR9_9HYPH|nr:ABC transporter permease [Rhizobium calliandrae]MDL2408558.1 ABC transporter permease [Rhizobium calliandrae]
MELLTGLLTTAFLAGGVLALAALGEVLAERVGVVNLGVEGLMAMGALTAIAATTSFPSPILGFVAALLVGAAFGTLFAAATVLLRANQVLCGLALTLMGNGIASSIGRAYSGMPARATFSGVQIPLFSDIPILGKAFFSQNILVYLIYIVLPVAVNYVMFRTRHGLNLRAVGENPAAADAAGIPVNLIRFAYVTLGSALAAGAGAYLTLAFVPSWSDGVVAGRGWIAVALVIFAGYRPIPAVLSGLLFGLITAIGFVGQARGWPIAPAFLSMLPYLGTMAFIIVPVLAWQRMRRIMAAPAAIGLPYYRDVR